MKKIFGLFFIAMCLAGLAFNYYEKPVTGSVFIYSDTALKPATLPVRVSLYEQNFGPLYRSFPGTDSLRAYNNIWITNNSSLAFTNYRLHTLLEGMIDWIDSARLGLGGQPGVDSIAAVNDSTFRYRKNGTFHNIVIRGGIDQNNLTTGTSFNTGTGILTTTRSGLSSLTVDLDGRYVNTVLRRSDSVFYTKDGVETFIFRDSTAGITVGTLYDKKSWSNLSDFLDQSSGAAIVSNHLQFTGGGNVYTNTLGILPYNGLEKWRSSIIVFADEKSSTSFGFGIGHRSANSSSTFYTQMVCRFDMTTGANSGKIFIDAGNSTYSNVASSSSALSFSVGDSLLFTVERDMHVITASVKNMTTNSAVITASYTYVFNASPFQPNTGNISIYNFGGQFTVDSLGLNSKEVKRPEIMVIGDSKTNGGNATDLNTRFVTLLNNSYATTIPNSGQGDKTGEIIKILDQVVTYVNPKRVLLAIGSNDIRGGISSGTWQANYDSITRRLTNAGITVYHCLPFKEVVLDQSALSSYIQSTYAANKIIDTETPTKRCSSCTAGDGIHPNDAGHTIIANAIIDFNLPGADKLNHPLFTLRNQYDRAQTYTSFISGKFKTSDSVVSNALAVTTGAKFYGTNLRITNEGFSGAPALHNSSFMYLIADADITVFRGGTGNSNRPCLQLESISGTTQSKSELRGFNNNTSTVANMPLYVHTTGFSNGGAGDVHIMAGATTTGGSAPTGTVFGTYHIYLEQGGKLKISPPASGALTDSIVMRRVSDSGIYHISPTQLVSSATNYSGSYTATLTNGTNVAASAFQQAFYIRSGNIVTVTMYITIDPTSTGATDIGISLPIASNLAAGTDLLGHGACTSVPLQTVTLAADTGNDRANLVFTATDTNNQAFYFTFTYQIL